MKDTRRLFLLISIMVAISLTITAIAITLLYHTSIEQQQSRLTETAQSQARLIEAISRFDRRHQAKWHAQKGSPDDATISQVIDSHSHYKGFGKSGEFTLARQDGDQIVFILSHRHSDLENPLPVKFDSDLAEPMRLALSGKSGSIIGLDYRGEIVLAAYEPVSDLNLGIVAKIDLSEIRAPFVRAGVLSVCLALLIISGGALLFIKITSPMLKQLQESEEQFRRLVTSAPLPLCFVDLEGRLKTINNRFMKTFGYTLEDVPDLDAWWLRAYPDEKYRQEVLDAWNAAVEKAETENTDIQPIEYLVTCKNGTERTMEIGGIVLENGFLAAFVDVTDRKQAQEQLKQLNENLARSNKELEQFAYMVSHDLQEPLRMISSYLQLLERRYKDKLDQDALEFINFAVDGAARMKSLITDLLAISRVETKGKSFEQFMMGTAFKEAAANLNPLIEETDAVITCSELPEIVADKGQIVQLFQNLVSNAIKYRSEEIPKINIAAHKQSGQWVFSVKDNGMGIDPQFFDRIFVIFQRLHGKGDENKGAGIGLAICKKIVERHGGEIWVESEPGKGTTFYFTLAREINN